MQGIREHGYRLCSQVQTRIPNMCIIPSVAAAAKSFPLWLKHTEVIGGGSSPRGRTVFNKVWTGLGLRILMK